MIVLLSLPALLLLCLTSELRSQVVSTELIDTFSPEEVVDVAGDFGIPEGTVNINYAVDYYRVGYMTLHPNGDSVLVSGGLALPHAGSCPLPLVCYAHGTVTTSQDVPSNLSGEGLLGVIYAGAGYAAVLPDYIGFGMSDLFHPYVHAESEAQACIDLMRGAVDLQSEMEFNLSGENFVFGYSQGGHAAMALHRKIELEYPEEFEVTASAPMSGPYDISGVQTDMIIDNQPFSFPGFLPYVVMGYQAAYGDLYDSLDEIFQEPYASELPDLFDGTNSIGYISTQLPSVPNEMLLPEVFEAFQTDPQHPLRLALADNDVYDWAPLAPTRLYYCTEDEQVNYQNALVAEEAMINNGALDIEALNGGPYDHGECAGLAMLGGFFFFESYRTIPYAPELDYVTVPATGPDNADGSIEITSDENLSGTTITWNTGETGNPLTNANPGTYIAYVTNEEGCTASIETDLDFVTGIATENSTVLELTVRADQTVAVYWDSRSAQLQLYNNTGHLVRDVRLTNGLNVFHVGDLSPGIYVAHVKTATDRFTQKILLTR